MAEVEIHVGNLAEDSDAVDLELSLPVAGGTPLYFDSAEEAAAYPVAQQLVSLSSVSALLLQEHKITICRSNDAGSWNEILDEVKSIIVRHFAEQPEPEPPRDRTEAENELMLKIQNVLNTEINPYVASHGGFIEVLDVRDTTAFLNMSGGCQGCGMAAVTLKQGVERSLQERVPEITRILDTTDHAAGANPYYQP